MNIKELTTIYQISPRSLRHWKKGYLWEIHGRKKKAKSKLPFTRRLNENRRWERWYDIESVLKWCDENGITLHKR